MDTTTHTHHASHTQAATGGSWSMAARATLHCLTGCAIGEILGLVIGTALGLSTGATIALAIALAFVFGYALTLTPVLRSGVALKAALAVTLAADTVSITVMELVDNSVMLLVPGAMAVLGWATGDVLVGAGAALFVVSDTVLALGKFVEARPWTRLVVIVTYHLAQALLVVGLLG